MFAFSFKTSKKRTIILLFVLILLIFTIFLILNKCSKQTYAVASTEKYNLLAKDNTSRIAFLSQFGWEVSSEPYEVSDVKIPEVFNSTYENYNKIQKEQGLNLEKYKGKACKRYSYQVLNYGLNNCTVKANMLVLNDYIIGGDVCSVELGGFMHGFVNPNATKTNNFICEPESSLNIQQKDSKSTQRQTLAPDPNMPNAPTD